MAKTKTREEEREDKHLTGMDGNKLISTSNINLVPAGHKGIDLSQATKKERKDHIEKNAKKVVDYVDFMKGQK